MTPISEDDLLHKMEQSLNNISFDELNKLCEQHFGQPRQKGSHLVFRTPWPGDPRINIQSDKGKAKPYQVRQVIAAIKKMRENI